MIRAVTFDLWDTLVVDDSDEEVRQALSLPSKREARERALLHALEGRASEEAIRAAWEASLQWFQRCWKEEQHTPPVTERIRETLRQLSLPLEPAEWPHAELVDALERMELELPPRTLPGAAEALDSLGRRYALGIVSDAIMTPGVHLRQILQNHELLHAFRVTVFSDEAGAAKPAPLVFERAAAGLGVRLDEMVHIGDRESNDILGPRALGMKSILFTGAVDRGSDESLADAICSDLRDLPAILAAL